MSIYGHFLFISLVPCLIISFFNIYCEFVYVLNLYIHCVKSVFSMYFYNTLKVYVLGKKSKGGR